MLAPSLAVLFDTPAALTTGMPWWASLLIIVASSVLVPLLLARLTAKTQELQSAHQGAVKLDETKLASFGVVVTKAVEDRDKITEQLLKQVAQQVADFNSLRERFDRAEEKHRSDLDRLRNEYTSEIETLRAEQKQTRDEFFNLVNSYTKLQADHDQLKDYVAKLEHERGALSDENGDLRETVAAMRAEIDDLIAQMERRASPRTIADGRTGIQP